MGRARLPERAHLASLCVCSLHGRRQPSTKGCNQFTSSAFKGRQREGQVRYSTRAVAANAGRRGRDYASRNKRTSKKSRPNRDPRKAPKLRILQDIPSPGCALPRRLLAYCMTDPQRPVYHAAIIRTYHILVAKSEHRLSTSTKEGDLLLCLTQSRRILIPTFFQSEEVARLELTMDHPWDPMTVKQTSRPRRRHLHRREKTTLTNTTTPCVTAICCCCVCPSDDKVAMPI